MNPFIAPDETSSSAPKSNGALLKSLPAHPPYGNVSQQRQRKGFRLPRLLVNPFVLRRDSAGLPVPQSSEDNTQVRVVWIVGLIVVVLAGVLLWFGANYRVPTEPNYSGEVDSFEDAPNQPFPANPDAPGQAPPRDGDQVPIGTPGSDTNAEPGAPSAAQPTPPPGQPGAATPQPGQPGAQPGNPNDPPPGNNQPGDPDPAKPGSVLPPAFVFFDKLPGDDWFASAPSMYSGTEGVTAGQFNMVSLVNDPKNYFCTIWSVRGKYALDWGTSVIGDMEKTALPYGELYLRDQHAVIQRDGIGPNRVSVMVNCSNGFNESAMHAVINGITIK